MNSQFNGRKRALSVVMAAVVVVAVIIAILGITYIALVFPGSIAGSTSNTLPESSISIVPAPNLPSTFSNTNVFIPVGAAIEGRVATFNPQNVTVAIGVNNTIIWTNLDNATHVVVAANGSFKSGNITQGSAWNYTFSTPGVYHYSDPSYGWLNGTVTVVS